MNHKHRIKRGFTLVEILVVLGIITLLAAIVFPVASSVREGARTASCASNLSQISKAMSLYVEDNGRYPLIVQSEGCTWVDAVYPYLKSTSIFVCPSAEHGEYVPGCGSGEVIPNSTPLMRYGENGSYDMVTPFTEAKTTPTSTGSSSTYSVERKSLSPQRYRFPSSTILLLDGSDTTYFFHNNFAAVNPGIDPIRSIADLKDGGVLARHKSGVNLLYVDGHIKWQKLESLASTPMWRYDGREPVPSETPIPLK